jgi:hypothetical protein
MLKAFIALRSLLFAGYLFLESIPGLRRYIRIIDVRVARRRVTTALRCHVARHVWAIPPAPRSDLRFSSWRLLEATS